MVTVEGKAGIRATVLKDSISEAGVRLITYELVYCRLVHSELMTHRMFSRNAASSRAIPFAKMGQQLEGKPVRFGKNQAGMQDSGEHTELINGLYTPDEWWHLANLSAKNFAQGYADAGYHKQVSGRITEPYQLIKTIVSSTDYANWEWLRDDDAADPSIRELAVCMLKAKKQSVPQFLHAGDYHLPYITSRWNGIICERMYFLDEACTEEVSLEDAIKVSCSRCAAVSYRADEYGIEKCLSVYEKLIGDERKHASAMEHCATPMPADVSFETEGVTALHKKLGYMSGNFAGWLQHRQFIEGHTKYED